MENSTYTFELRPSEDVCSAAVIKAIDMIAKYSDDTRYCLDCSKSNVFNSYLAITPIDGVNIQVKTCIGYRAREWSVSIGEEHRVIVHSAGT